jgi:hypothetical protein
MEPAHQLGFHVVRRPYALRVLKGGGMAKEGPRYAVEGMTELKAAASMLRPWRTAPSNVTTGPLDASPYLR